MLGIASITYKVTHYSFDLSTKSVTSCKRLDLFDNQVGVQRRREARADINKGDASNPVNSEAVVKAEYHTEKPPTPLLDTINFPIHLKNLNIKVITCIQNLPRFVFKNIQVNIPTDIWPASRNAWGASIGEKIPLSQPQDVHVRY